MAGQAHDAVALDELVLDDLTEGQRRVLLTVAGSELANGLYLTGGTALRAAYLHHRSSVDIDFFSRARIPSEAVLALLRGADHAA